MCLDRRRWLSSTLLSLTLTLPGCKSKQGQIPSDCCLAWARRHSCCATCWCSQNSNSWWPIQVSCQDSWSGFPVKSSLVDNGLILQFVLQITLQFGGRPWDRIWDWPSLCQSSTCGCSWGPRQTGVRSYPLHPLQENRTFQINVFFLSSGGKC